MSNDVSAGIGLSFEAALTGYLFGGAVGDALGLPREGLTPVRARRLFGDEVRHSFIGRRGMVSDDTEHALMTACSLLEHGVNPDAFGLGLARRLRGWLLLLPAGAGLATLRACLRLWCGISPKRSGVFSAGNGPMMRAPIIGVYCRDDTSVLRDMVAASTRMTHTDPKAERAALLVAAAAANASNGLDGATPAYTAASLLAFVPDADEDLQALMERAADPAPLTEQWHKGPGGYAYDTLLAVLHTWLHNRRDFAEAIRTIIALGGDTDTTAAVLGGITGAGLGSASIPPEWLHGLCEWPRHEKWMRELARRMSVGEGRCPSWHSCSTLLRNIIFLAAVLTHGFRRLLP